MIRFRLFGVEFFISFWFFAVLGFILITGREALAFYLLLPVLIHECGHLLVMAVCGMRIKTVRFLAFCIDIRRCEDRLPSYGKDIAAALGGVLANFAAAGLLYFFAFQSMRMMLMVSVNIAVALFNLVPIGRLDGGRVMGLLLARFGALENGAHISKLCSFLLLVPLFALTIFLILQDAYNTPLLPVCLYLAGMVIYS
ncbi:MAG: hypothetical protein FWH02_05725 [Oscillospiraceae bacterium]|nr:hypothetical protein [Oscillospiraceae bacterium]